MNKKLYDPTVYYLQETHFRYKDASGRLEVKG